MFENKVIQAISGMIIAFLAGLCVALSAIGYDEMKGAIRACEEKLTRTQHCELIAVPIIEATHEN